MRTISATLIAGQQAASRTPYIKMLFTDKAGTTTKDFSTDSVAFGNRIIAIDHNEEAYNEYALVLLRDYDSTIPDITGYWTNIGYGLTTGAGNESTGTLTPRLWVKHQRHISVGGKLVTVLELEGMWSKLREALLRMGTAPYYKKIYDGSADSIYVILGAVFTEVFGAGALSALGGVDDSIINTLLPVFTIDSVPFEYSAGVIYRLIRLTKCYLRSRYSATYADAFQVVYPQAADAANETYYSNPTIGSQNGFYSYMERAGVLAPNHIFVFYDRNTDGSWDSPALYGEASSAADIAKYDDVYKIDIAPDVTTSVMANLLAAAVLARVRAEQDTGLLVGPHDASVELYDKIAVVDNRGSGATYPTNSLSRVSGLHHIYKPGQYKLEIYVGGLSNTSMDEYTADTYIMGKDISGQKVEIPPLKTPTEITSYGPAVPPSPTPSETRFIEALRGGLVPEPSPTIPSDVVTPSGPPLPTWTPTEPEPEQTWWQRITPWEEPRGETFGTVFSNIWQAVTPWSEAAGETFGSEVKERITSVTDWFKRIFNR